MKYEVNENGTIKLFKVPEVEFDYSILTLEQLEKIIEQQNIELNEILQKNNPLVFMILEPPNESTMYRNIYINETYAFSIIQEDFANELKKEAIKNGYYRTEDWIESNQMIITKRALITINDIGRMIRYWINKYHKSISNKEIYITQYPDSEKPYLRI